MAKKLLRRMRKDKAGLGIQGLHDMMKYISQFCKLEEMVMVEIGSYLGESAEIFAQYVKELYCIDPWQPNYDSEDYAAWKYDLNEVYEIYKERVKSYSNIKTIRMSSENAVKNFKKHSIDLVYIDGNHQPNYVDKDINMWYPVVKDNGWITGHDYDIEKYEALVKVVDNHCQGIPEKTFVDTSWCAKKENVKI